MRATQPAPAALAHQAASGLERPPGPVDGGVMVLEPMQGGVGEHGVELRAEIQFLPVGHPCVQPQLARGLHLCGAGIDPDDIAAEGCQLRGQGAVAAAEIENAFTGQRRQQLDHGSAQGGDEPGVGPIAFGIPGLRHGECIASSPCIPGCTASPEREESFTGMESPRVR